MANARKLSSGFEHEIGDPTASPPPELPLETIQAIATKQCQIPLERVSREKLKASVDHDNSRIDSKWSCCDKTLLGLKPPFIYPGTGYLLLLYLRTWSIRS